MTQVDVPTSNMIQVECRVLRLNKSKGNLSTRHYLLAYQITNPNRSLEMVHQLCQRTRRRIQREHRPKNHQQTIPTLLEEHMYLSHAILELNNQTSCRPIPPEHLVRFRQGIKRLETGVHATFLFRLLIIHNCSIPKFG